MARYRRDIMSRVRMFSRPLHWEYVYDPMGKALVRLYRVLGMLRNRYRALGSRGYLYYYNGRSGRARDPPDRDP